MKDLPLNKHIKKTKTKGYPFSYKVEGVTYYTDIAPICGNVDYDTFNTFIEILLIEAKYKFNKGINK